jgi:hypothetical protein
MLQTDRTIQEFMTTVPPRAVLAAARRFFSRSLNIYSAFLEREGPTFCAFRGQGGEELLIAVEERDGATRVTGSSYLFDQQIARFFATLPPAAAQ